MLSEEIIWQSNFNEIQWPNAVYKHMYNYEVKSKELAFSAVVIMNIPYSLSFITELLSDSTNISN